MKDYRNVIFDIAKTNGVGRLIVGENVIPVKVTDIKSEHTIDSHETEFKCIAVEPSASYVDTDSVYPSITPAINSVYDMLSGRMNGKSAEEYATMKEYLKKGYHLLPIRTGKRSWIAQAPHDVSKRILDIDKVIFSNPATIVFWTDGEKTVVKAQNGEPYDPEKGLAMAISKRALGNKGNYCNVLNKHLTKGMENFTPEQFNSEVCHSKDYEDLWEKFRNEVGHTNTALAALNSVVYYKKATKAQILDAVNEAIKHLDRLKRDAET